MRDSFVFFRSFFDAIECLEDDREKAEAYRAVIKYALDGDQEEQSGACRVIMMMARPILDFSRKQYENGVKGGRPKKPKQNPTETQPKPKHNPPITQTKPNQNLNQNENQNLNVNAKEGRGEDRAPAPTAAQVTEYAQGIGYQLDGQTFVDKYSATGWMLNGAPIRDWKALVRRWKAQDEKTKDKVHNFDERGDDLDAEVLAKYKQRFAGRA